MPKSNSETGDLITKNTMLNYFFLSQISGLLDSSCVIHSEHRVSLIMNFIYSLQSIQLERKKLTIVYYLHDEPKFLVMK